MECSPALSAELSLQTREAIRQKIAEIRAVEDLLPQVIIIHHISDLSVVHMSQRGLKLLGLSLEDVQKIGAEYHHRYFNPEDTKHYIPKIQELLARNNDDLITFFQQVRPSENEEWTWYASSSKILLRDAAGQPVLVITTAIPIDQTHYITNKVERLLEEHTFLFNNKRLFESLTNREVEILRLMALGLNSSEMAAQLHISETTATTHRRNIKRKLNIQTAYDVTRFAQAFDLI